MILTREILGNHVSNFENIPFTLNFATKAQSRMGNIENAETELDYNPKLQMNNLSLSNSMGGSTCNRQSGTTTTWIGGTDHDDDNMQDD